MILQIASGIQIISHNITFVCVHQCVFRDAALYQFLHQWQSHLYTILGAIDLDLEVGKFLIIFVTAVICKSMMKTLYF